MTEVYGHGHKTIRQMRAAINELIADAATEKTSADVVETALEELIDDHATFKTAVDAIEVLAEELHDDHAIGITWDTEVDGDLDDINDYLSFVNEVDGVIDGNFTFAGTAAATALGAGRVRYRIGGEEYECALDTTITLTGTTQVTGSNWRAWRVVIDRLGVVTTESPDNAGQAAEQTALLELGSISQAANTCELGTFTIQASTGFTPATDNTSGEASFTARELRGPKIKWSTLFAAQGTALVAGAGLATVAVGVTSPRVNGLRLATIAADATLALTDADTITTTNAGGWLVLTDLAGTGYVTLSSDGVPGVSALTDTDAAGALTALNLVAARLPAQFVPIGYVTVVTANAATFTAKTTFWDATDVTTAVADQTLGVFDRTVSAATFLARKSNPPAVPATITAPLIATITAPKPASGPATFGTAKPASGPASLTATALSDPQGTP